MSSPWEILELAPTNDLHLIKNAYAKLIKAYRPETNPQKFKEIRAAYEEIINAINQGIDLITENLPNVEQEEKELSERERLFAALDYLMSIYDDYTSKNDLKKWKTALLENSLILNLENLSRTGHSLLREILKYEFLYKNELKLAPEIYLALFNFFNLDYQTYLLENYNSLIANELIAQISSHEEILKQSLIPKTKFNNFTPEYQFNSEVFLQKEILAYSETSLVKRTNVLLDLITQKSAAQKTVMARVAFKYILEDYLSVNPTLSNSQIAVIFHIFNFKVKKYGFIRTFSQLGYHKRDVINCFEFCQQAYKQTKGKDHVFYFLAKWILILMALSVSYAFKFKIN